MSQVVSYPLQEETLGSLELFVAPEIGFLARFNVIVTDDGGPGRGRNDGDTFDLVQFLSGRSS